MTASPARSIGFWLAAAIALLQAVNAARAFIDPAGFAQYLGLPLANAADAPLIYIYGLRTGFIALAVAALLATRNMRALSWIALAGVVIPLGDAWLAHNAGAPIATVARHGAIALYLVLTCALLFSWTHRHAGT
jgi:hypothetical protein